MHISFSPCTALGNIFMIISIVLLLISKKRWKEVNKKRYEIIHEQEEIIDKWKKVNAQQKDTNKQLREIKSIKDDYDSLGSSLLSLRQTNNGDVIQIYRDFAIQSDSFLPEVDFPFVLLLANSSVRIISHYNLIDGTDGCLCSYEVYKKNIEDVSFRKEYSHIPLLDESREIIISSLDIYQLKLDEFAHKEYGKYTEFKFNNP